MRLTCPNCDAQYEVPDEVMPVSGRDVQCSNCGQTWFQHHPDHMPAEDDQPPEPPDTPVDDDPGPEQDSASEQEPDESSEQEDKAPELPSEGPTRRELDPAVANILQQEAETEQQARKKAASDPLESQPDLGLPDTDEADTPPTEEQERRTAEARQRMARMRGEPEPMSDAAVTAAAISSRRDLLPDIEEINSTLRSESERGSGPDGQAGFDAPSEVKRRSGFRRGFLLMILLFVLLSLLYIYAPRLSQSVPQLDGLLTSYVAWVDQLRLWLDAQIQGLAQWLDAKASESGG
ncbi:zinc-ribbon domain-containing protein [Sulfitobacter aestuariivivens]|uniref:Zinc-ribbon domain-containing protein n=1 Tax=Sulfitobacter aestuariivivens TaxID=2766981 RepID=A0A927HF37_9RHOB|nr:zinc-ribbon domain-containing protein [Sulfitobacter aestuariivivens]MBD3664029.1 zinc-ribbon domain-containing protein [Sulfitobacter aestuariivivens]